LVLAKDKVTHCQAEIARFLDDNCDKLTDKRTGLRRTTEKWRSPRSRWPVTAMSLASAVALSACRSVYRSSRLEISSSVDLRVHDSAAVSRNSALTYRPT